MSDYLIALDQGSSSSRALALDAKGRILGRSQFPIKTFYTRPGWIEHDANDLLSSQERALDGALLKIPKTGRIAGLGLS
jgi:glycerol kinase